MGVITRGCTSPRRVARLCCLGRGGRVAEGGGLLSRPPARGAVVSWAIRARPGHYGPPLPEWTGSAMAVRMAEFGGGFLNRRTAPKECFACCMWSAPPFRTTGRVTILQVASATARRFELRMAQLGSPDHYNHTGAIIRYALQGLSGNLGLSVRAVRRRASNRRSTARQPRRQHLRRLLPSGI